MCPFDKCCLFAHDVDELRRCPFEYGSNKMCVVRQCAACDFCSALLLKSYVPCPLKAFAVQLCAVPQLAGASLVTLGFSAHHVFSNCKNLLHLPSFPHRVSLFALGEFCRLTCRILLSAILHPSFCHLQFGGSCEHVICIYSKYLTESLYPLERYKSKLRTSLQRGRYVFVFSFVSEKVSASMS
jgi:hypothetical protein